MLSPLGITSRPEDYKFGEELKKKPSPIALKLFKSGWKKRISPFKIMRKGGKLLTSKMLKRFAGRRLTGLPEEEAKIFAKYLYQTLLRKGSTEYALFNCFTFELFAIHALDSDDRLCQLPIPVSFYFGDKDWMRKGGVSKIIENNPHKDQCRNILVENSDHHLYFDNPVDFARLLIEEL